MQPKMPAQDYAKRAYKPGSVVGDNLSRAYIAICLKHATRVQIGPILSTPICACSKWGLPSHSIAGVLVVSYTTVSAFLLPRMRQRESSFLRRFPSGFPAWLLASILPCGARTFLMSYKRPVAARLALQAFIVAFPRVRVLLSRARSHKKLETHIVLSSKVHVEIHEDIKE